MTTSDRSVQRSKHIHKIKAAKPRKLPNLKNHVSFGDVLYTVIGILFAGFALKSFLVPNHFLDGGVTGVSLLFHELYHIPLSLLLILINIPFFILGKFQVNTSFAIKSFISAVLLTVCLEFSPIRLILHMTS
jgi:uncharacterized membrane-anchored protein YitT (DUF2179 family)